MKTPTLLIIGLIGLAMPFLAPCQDMSPRVTNMAGFDLGASDLVITVSIGEPAISTLINEEYAITQGFLQPEVLPCGELSIRYFPNPARKDISVQALGCDISIQRVEVIDLWGRLILSQKPDADHKINLEYLSQGTYILKLLLSDNSITNVNIVKVSN